MIEHLFDYPIGSSQPLYGSPTSPDVIRSEVPLPTSVSIHGRELIATAHSIDRSLADWVLQLADFDASGVWRDDGFGSCASWLTDRCDMSRSDAFEKLKVSHELRRRPVVREAFENGLPYSKTRLLVRLDGIDHERDAEYVGYAVNDSVRVVESRVLNWNYFNGQDKKPTTLDDHYGIRRQRGFGSGLGKVVIEAPDDMLDRLFAMLDAYGDFLFKNDGKPATLKMQAVDESTQWIGSVDESTQWTDEPVRSSSAKRLDYLFDLLEEVALSAPDKLDPFNAAVGVSVQYEDLLSNSGTGLSTQQSVLTPETIHRLLCDADVHRLVVKGESEIIDLGRSERLFNRKQRRAARFRHNHTCAVRGCDRRITHMHHVRWWEKDGETNIDNALPLCSFHHHLVHEGGWNAAWNPTTGVTRLEGPKGQVLETETRIGRLVA